MDSQELGHQPSLLSKAEMLHQQRQQLQAKQI
jgi:hypothetical protein